jgi:uncharacterized protein YjbI with pentapeptide repeats
VSTRRAPGRMSEPVSSRLGANSSREASTGSHEANTRLGEETLAPSDTDTSSSKRGDGRALAVGAIAAPIVALLAAIVALSLGLQANEVASLAQREAATSSHATQFGAAVEQLASAAPVTQMGGILSIEQVIQADQANYRSRGCELFVSFVDAQAPRTDSAAGQASVAVVAALKAIGRSCVGFKSQFSNLRLDGIRIRQADLSEVQWDGFSLVKAAVFDSSFKGAYFRSADFSQALLTNVDLSGAQVWNQSNFVGARIESSKLNKTRFSGANFETANFFCSNLDGADLYGSDFKWASVEHTSLVGAQLQYVDLENASLTRANMAGANFEGANLALTKLDFANLAGADLSRTSLSQASLREIAYDSETRWPAGFMPASPSVPYQSWNEGVCTQ